MYFDSFPVAKRTRLENFKATSKICDDSKRSRCYKEGKRRRYVVKITIKICFIYVKIQLTNRRSIDGVLGIWTRDHGMEGTNKAIELGMAAHKICSSMTMVFTSWRVGGRPPWTFSALEDQLRAKFRPDLSIGLDFYREHTDKQTYRHCPLFSRCRWYLKDGYFGKLNRLHSEVSCSRREKGSFDLDIVSFPISLSSCFLSFGEHQKNANLKNQLVSKRFERQSAKLWKQKIPF